MLARAPVAAAPSAFSSAPIVSQTFVPYNDSLLPGNTQPMQTSQPTGVAYFAPLDRAIVSYSGTETISFVNASEDRITSSLGPDYGLSSDSEIAIDPLNGLGFIADGGSCSVRVVNMTSMTLVTTVGTRCAPGPIIFDPGDSDIYVGTWSISRPCVTPGVVEVIDPSSLRILRNLSVAAAVEGLAYDPVTDSVIVAASDAGFGSYCSASASYLESFNGSSLTPSFNRSVTREYSSLGYDGANGELVGALSEEADFLNASTGAYISNVTWSGFTAGWPVEDVLYVNQTDDLYLSGLSGDLVVLSGANGSVLGQYSEWSPFGGGISFSQPPPPFQELAFDPDSDLLYVASQTFDEVFRFNVTEAKFVEPLIVQFTPGDLQSNPSGTRVFLAGDNPGADIIYNATNLQPIDPFNVSFSTGNDNCGVFDPALGAFAVCVGGAVGVVYPENGTDEVSGAFMGNDQSGIAWDSKSSQIWTTDPTTARAYFANDSNLSSGSSIPLGANASGIAYDSARDELILIAAGDVLAFGGTNLSSVFNVSVGGSLSNEVLDADNGTLYFTEASASGHWFVAWNLSTRRVDYSTPISAGAEAIVLATPIARAYVLNAPANNVSVINLTSHQLLGTISVGDDPESGLYEASLGRVLVANGGSESISIIGVPHPYLVQFNETGLPAGTDWSVQVNGHTTSGTNASLSLELGNGTYTYSIGPVTAYAPDAGNGSLTISGSDVAVPILFRHVWPVDFIEQGLTAGTTWSVGLNGSANSSATSLVGFEVPNGSYPYRVTNLSGWHTAAYTGRVTVAGGPVVVTVNWTVVTYSVDVTESGLPNGTSWAVTVGGSTNRSTTSTVSFRLGNGTFAFNISLVAGWQPKAESGNLTVNGTAVQIATNWTAVHYAVDFVESGLAPGTSWSVTLNGTMNASSTSFVAFEEPNGTYRFTVAALSGWSTSRYAGTVTVDGDSSTVTVTWTEVTYSIVVEEVGLPTGTNWSVTLGGRTIATSVASTTFTEANGTYAWSISPLAGYTTQWVGEATVRGGDQQINVTFALVTYALTFTESGLPVGTSWSVSLDSRDLRTSNASLTILEPNGTYTFHLGGVPGFTTTEFVGAASISGAALSRTILWIPFTFPVTLTETGLPTGDAWWVNVSKIDVATISTADTVAFRAPNGTLDASIASADKTYAAPGEVVEVDGGASEGSVAFSRVVFEVTFDENGLPAGTGWWLYLTGAPPTFSTSSSVEIPLPNGTYGDSLAASDPKYGSPSGNFAVEGGPTERTVAFTLLVYTLTFLATGLVDGAEWSVTIGGTTHTGSATVAFPGLANGTYSYRLDPPADYSVGSLTGSVVLNGSNLSRAISFLPEASARTSSPALGGPEVDLLIGAAVTAAVVVGLLLMRVGRRRSVMSAEGVPPVEPGTEPDLVTDPPD